MGLAAERQEVYLVERVVIGSFFRVRNTILPFQVFYVAFFGSTLAALLAILSVTSSESITSFEFIALVGNAVALAASIYEIRKTMKEFP